MKQWHLFCLLPLMAACDSGHSGSGELISVDLRQGIDHPSMLNLQDEVESVEYIPLETTDDPASLLDGVSEYALTSKYIYVSPVKEQRIVQFDRKGHFIKTLIPFGQVNEFNKVAMTPLEDIPKNCKFLRICAVFYH